MADGSGTAAGTTDGDAGDLGGAAEGSARGSAWKGSGGEADIRTVVDTARLKPGTSVVSTILQAITA